MKRTAKSGADVVIVGGGVIGCGSAWQLAERGARVIVLERSVPGAEASSAAAGILGAQSEAEHDGPMFELALGSRARYPKWAKALVARTGIDVEHRASGCFHVAFSRARAAELARTHAFQRRRGCRVENVGRARLRRELGALSERLAGAVAFPDDARVDPPRLLRALRIAAERAGVEFRTGTYVRRVALESGAARGVVLDDGSTVPAGSVVIAAGSWSSLVEGVALPSGGVVPARGQIVELVLPAPPFTPVVYGPRCYLVPRDDGRVLVGSTLEFVGYRREVTAIAVRDLLDAAIELAPALASAELGRTWSSFRPYTRDGRPVLGRDASTGVVLATGHHRSGILLAPISADIVCALVLGRRPPLDLTAFSPERTEVAASPGSARRSRLRPR